MYTGQLKTQSKQLNDAEKIFQQVIYTITLHNSKYWTRRFDKHNLKQKGEYRYCLKLLGKCTHEDKGGRVHFPYKIKNLGFTTRYRLSEFSKFH